MQLDLQVTRAGSNKIEQFGFNTGDMIWSIEEQISFMSRRMVLNPGDIILSGSCVPPQILHGDTASFQLTYEGQKLASMQFEFK